MAEAVEYLVLEPTDERWLAFATSNLQANVFHHPTWLELLTKCYGYRSFVIAVCDATGEICAGLPMMEISSPLTGRRWVSLPFTDYCAPLYRDASSLRALSNSIAALSQDKRLSRVELRWEFPANPDIQLDSQYVVHTIRLCPDPDQVAARFERVHRQNVRTAEKRGVRIEQGTQREHLHLYYQLQLETRHRKGIPAQPVRLFENMADILFDRGLGFVLLAYKDDECLAGILFLHWQQSLIAKYAASREDTLNLRPNNLLFWSGMRWGCENGYTVFDMGRTDLTNEGLRRYKRGWGADETPLTYSYMHGKPAAWTGTSKLMNVMQATIRHSPAWVCQFAGELLYRHVA
jgi:CelD/BcsL family acetyltransferase involved in cellulose biosynthesis